MDDIAAKTIVLADDEQFIAIAFKDGLEHAGYVVIVASDGEQAIDLTRTHRPDLLLLDLIMPKMNGFEVLREIKADTVLSVIPVIIFTNLSQPSDKAEAVASGAEDFIVKTDVSLKDLLVRIEQLFS